jgi:signal transduction histidine kinase
MSLYPLIPLVSCIVCAVLASAILARDLGQPANRLAAALMIGASFWAFCETLWLGQSDPTAVLALVRLSGLGWVWMAPVALHLFLELSDERWPGTRRALPWLYAGSGLFLLLDWFTPWVHPGVVRTSWGWGYDLGVAYPFFYAFMMGCVARGLWIGWKTIGRSSSPAAQLQVRGISLGILIPLVAASLSDGLLPLMGVYPPHLGTASFAVLGATMLWTFRRHGYLLLAPRSFTGEILETLPDGVAMVGLDGRVQSANGALARLLEARPDQVMGVRLTDRLSEPVHPTDQVMERQCELRTLAARSVPVAISSRLLRNEMGRQLGIVVVVRDLQEVVALRDRLLLSGRLAAVGELAAGIAHEINNPLAFVRANLGLLRQHWGSLAQKLEKAAPTESDQELLREGEELVDESLEGVDRAAAIVRDVRGLSHAGDGERKACDLNALLRGVLRIAGPQLRGRATVEEVLGDVPPVWGAPQELQQVFLNLVLNAVQSFDGTGVLRIVTECEGRFVVARVQDDGSGIDPEIRDRIFDPFFTTKKVGEGTGLGLGIAYGIVHNHGGDIAVESELGRGTCLDVHLPIATDTIDDS